MGLYQDPNWKQKLLEFLFKVTRLIVHLWVACGLYSNILYPWTGHLAQTSGRGMDTQTYIHTYMTYRLSPAI